MITDQYCVYRYLLFFSYRNELHVEWLHILGFTSVSVFICGFYGYSRLWLLCTLSKIKGERNRCHWKSGWDSSQRWKAGHSWAPVLRLWEFVLSPLSGLHLECMISMSLLTSLSWPWQNFNKAVIPGEISVTKSTGPLSLKPAVVYFSHL